jgi:EmrB/QacA subfamily drug resistance transporter
MDADNTALKTVATVVAALAAFLTPFMSSAVNVALPVIAGEFAMDAVSRYWVNIAFLLVAAVFLVPLGKVADLYGRKKVFAGGLLVYTLASLLCGLAPSALWLIGSRALQGLGGAMMFGTGVAILTSVFPAGERGKVLGLNTAVTYLGLSVGPALGGVLTQQLGWRSIFLIGVPLGLIALVLVFWKLKGEWAAGQGERFDFAGAVVYGLALVALMAGFSRLPALPGAALIAAGVVGLAAFIWWETRAANPVLNLNLFRRSAVFAFSNLAALINYSATFAVGVLLSQYLQYVKGFTPQQAGIALLPQPVVMAAFSWLTGWLSDKIEARILASAGMGVTVIGLALLAFLGEGTALGFIVFCLILLGLGFALFSSPNTNAVMGSVERQSYGVASATLATMRSVGQTFSQGIVIVVFAVTVGEVAITPQVYPQFLAAVRIAFGVFAALCFAGVFASLARGNMRK